MIRFAYLPEAAEPLMLLWGDAKSLAVLAALFRALPDAGSAVALGDQEFCQTANGDEITMAVGDTGGGLAGAAGKFTWNIRHADCARFAELVDVVTQSDRPCHLYLDTATGEGLTVKVSKGEYPDHSWP